MTSKWIEYKGKTVVVTGAFSGMGAATATLLVDAGATVFALDVKPCSLDGATYIECDLMDEAAIDQAIERLPANIDNLFCCAGLPTSFADGDVVAVNYFGHIRLIEGLVDRMPKGGAIASIASMSLGWTEQIGLVAQALPLRSISDGRAFVEANAEAIQAMSAYMFSKYCLIAYTVSHAPELMQTRGIRLNTLCPGQTDTPMMPVFKELNAEQMDALPLPAGRQARAEEQAHAMLFLNSPLASYVNGITLECDGGTVAAMMTNALIAPHM